MKKLLFHTGAFLLLVCSNSIYAQQSQRVTGNPTAVTVYVYKGTDILKEVKIECDGSNNQDCYKIEEVTEYKTGGLLKYKDPISNKYEVIKMANILEYRVEDFGKLTSSSILFSETKK